jgi:hypothetical protein
MMKKSTDLYYVMKNKIYLLESKLRPLYSHKVDFFFLSLLLVLSIVCFKDILRNDVILIHGDLRYALTVDEHLFHHLSNLPVHAAKLSLLSILYPLQLIFSDIAAEKVFTIMTLFLSATFVYIANKQMASRFEGTRGYWLSACCFVGSLVFIYNPWTINKIHHHYWLVVSLAASYLLITVIDSYLHSNKRNNVNRLMLMAFLTSLVASQPQSLIIYFLPMLAIYLTVNLIFHRPKILSKPAAKKISILVIISIACNVFWLVPAIQPLTTDGISQGVPYYEFPYGLVEENINQLSRRATLENVLQGTSAWLWGGDSTPDQSIRINNIDLWDKLLAFLPLSFIFLFFFIRKPIGKGIIYIVIFFIALVILSVILATGSYYNDIYTRFFLDFPFGEALRESYKFSGLYFLAVSFFASVSLYRLKRKSLGKNIVIILSMVGLIFSWGWVGLTGNLNGHLTESLLPYPHDLSDVSEYLHSEYGISSGDANGKIFWYPARGELTQLHYLTVPELSTESLPHLKLPPYQLNYVNHLITKNDTSFIPLLEYLGVQYLVIREDYVDNEEDLSPEPLQELQRRVQNLKTILHENMVFESGRFGVYKLNPTSPVSVSHAISTGTDDLSKIAGVAVESEYLNNIQMGPFLEDSLIVSDLLPPEPSERTIIIVDPTSEHHLPRKYWSAGAINGGYQDRILPYLNRSGIKTWQFDYDRGFIFTWAEKSDVSGQLVENSISVPFRVGNNDAYKVFVRYLESPQGGLINATLEDSNLIQISTLSPDSKFVWRDLGEYTLNQGTHTMTFTNERGFNAINVILLIQKDQFEAIKGQIQDWLNRNSSTAVYIFEAESDMNMNKATIVDEIPSGSDKIVLVNGTASKQFDVKKEGDYRIWIKGSGKFTVAINDHKEIVNATMNKPTFSDPFRLKEGDSGLEVTPLQEQEKLPSTSDHQSIRLADNTRNSKASDVINVIDSIWLISDSNNRLRELLDDDDNDRNVSLNQMQVTTTPISNNMWSSQKYEIKFNNNTTKPLMISLAEPFNPNLKAAIYTKDGLSKTENLIPLFYSLKSGIYIEDSLAKDEKVVIYDTSASLGWFAVTSFISLASYVLLILSANVKLTNGFKGLVCNLNHLMKQMISQKRKNNNNNRGYNS